MKLYRVFPHDPNVGAHEPGGALFSAPCANNRLSNPSLFSELYFSDSPVGAVAEAFGRLDVWSSTVLERNGRRYALAAYEFNDEERLCDLDDAARLLALRLKPSRVVARDRRVTQAWAARIYGMRKWSGIAWWSRYDSRWQSVGIWDRKRVTVVGETEELTLEHPMITEAATILPRCMQ